MNLNKTELQNWYKSVENNWIKKSKIMSDHSPIHSGADSPSSSSGNDGRARKSPDSLTGFESNPYANLSAAHQGPML
jgi:hypothetical protein